MATTRGCYWGVDYSNKSTKFRQKGPRGRSISSDCGSSSSPSPRRKWTLDRHAASRLIVPGELTTVTGVPNCCKRVLEEGASPVVAGAATRLLPGATGLSTCMLLAGPWLEPDERRSFGRYVDGRS